MAKGANAKSVNYYSAECEKCGGSLTHQRIETRATSSRWIKCGGDRGCGRVNLLPFVEEHSPDVALDAESYAKHFGGF